MALSESWPHKTSVSDGIACLSYSAAASSIKTAKEGRRFLQILRSPFQSEWALTAKTLYSFRWREMTFKVLSPIEPVAPKIVMFFTAQIPQIAQILEQKQ